MSVEIKEVKSRRELRRFVNFPEKLYRHNECYVPYLEFDQIDTLDHKTNPAAEFCDYKLYMAYKDGEEVGRVAAIVNHKNNEQWNHRQVRFGWIDFIDDREVSAALMAKVEELGREHGMDEIVGPLGFTDMDPEGTLIEGFDRESTMPQIYNDPYYQDHLEALGFRKDADWIEFRCQVPDKLPEKIERIEKIVLERNNLHIRNLTRSYIRKHDYAHKIFALDNETYKSLYNVTELPMEAADRYIGFYLSILDLRYLSCVETEDGQLVGFAITMPSLAHALKKSRGRLFPFGWWYLAHDLFIKHSDGAELLLIGVRPDYQNLGVNAVLIADLFRKYQKLGVKWAESNGELETNIKVQKQFELFGPDWCKRRRAYIKELK
ncbi:MAG: N-acetyltransferase [Bacteroidales bacterium]|nr:N-acetyltransferase [Bacteroidales bacterium]